MRIKFLLPIFFIFSAIVTSQTKGTEKSGQSDYLEFDGSKSLPNNVNRDRLYFLRVNSENIQLPNEVFSLLDSANDPEELKEKYELARISTLKVLYNPRIKNEDKLFFCERIIGKNSDMYIPIKGLLENYLYQNSN